MSVSTPPCALLLLPLPVSSFPSFAVALLRRSAVRGGRYRADAELPASRRGDDLTLSLPSPLLGESEPGPGKIIIRATGTGRAREPSRPINYASVAPRTAP